MAADPPPADVLPKEWAGEGGWDLVPEATKIHEGTRRPGDVLIEYRFKARRTGVIVETVQTRDAEGRDFIFPAGTKLFAENEAKQDWQGADPVEWCGMLPRGTDGKQDVAVVACLIWENPTSALYGRDVRNDSFGYGFRRRKLIATPGPLPRIEEQAVDFGRDSLSQMRLIKVTPDRLEVTRVLTDGTSEQRDEEWQVPWEKNRKAVVTSDGRQFEFSAAEDFTSVEFRHTGPAPAATAAPKPPATPIVRVCVDEKGALTGNPEIAESSGNAQLDEGALKVAKSGRYKPSRGQVGTHCFKFRVRFEFRE